MTKNIIPNSLLCLYILLTPVVFSQNLINNSEIPITTNSEKALELFFKGRNAVELNKIAEGIEFFKSAVKEYPNFFYAYYYLADYSGSN